MDNKTVAAFSWISLALAVVLLASWPLGLATGAAAINSIVGGLVVGGAAILALTYHRRWEAWANLLLLNLVAGGWVFIAPFLFHYNGENAATWTQILVGIALTGLATAQMWMIAPARMLPTLAR